MDYGILTLVPALVVLVLGILTKRTTESLFIGSILAYIIIGGTKFLSLLVEAVFSVMTNYDDAWLIFVCGLFGSFIALLEKSKGTDAVGVLIGKACKKERHTLIGSFFLGILIFVDDYLNIMTIGSCMRKACDKQRIPRESLAYIIDSTGAPVCILLPFSTWAIFYANTFYKEESVKALNLGSAMDTYIHALPYMFYAIIALVIVFLFAYGIFPKIGQMKKAYERVKEGGKTYSKESECLNMDSDDYIDENSNILDFLLPIVVLIVITIVYGDILYALIDAMAVCFIMYIPRKRIKIAEFFEVIVSGFQSTIPALAIILFALVMRNALGDLNMPNYVVNAVLPYVNSNTFPAIAFAVVGTVAFFTGSNWGTPAICAPIVLSVASACGANILLVMAAIACGGIFCSHACFYSDATILTSAACKIQNTDHAFTQLPYALISAGLSFIVFLIFGFII